MENTKFVDFYEYCPKCKHFTLDDSDDPCNECLTYPANESSHKPINFEEEKS